MDRLPVRVPKEMFASQKRYIVRVSLNCFIFNVVVSNNTVSIHSTEHDSDIYLQQYTASQRGSGRIEHSLYKIIGFSIKS